MTNVIKEYSQLYARELWFVLIPIHMANQILNVVNSINLKLLIIITK